MNRTKLIFAQTGTLFLDAYRELNAKRMFWIVLLISGVVVLAIGAIGVGAQSITIFGMETPFPALIDKGTLYRAVFTTLGINIWLTWAAMALAVISTASIFPDFMTSGSIDLFLSKPMSRLRLFLTKYASGLLFVGLQVSSFAAASFVTIGMRGGGWEPRVFLAIPLVVCIFSYLFCVSTFVALLTRSTLTAVLLTLLFWLGVFAVDVVDQNLLKIQLKSERTIARLDREVHDVDAQIRSLQHAPSTTAAFQGPGLFSRAQIGLLRSRREETLQSRESEQRSLQKLARFQKMTYATKTVLPKTNETNLIMNRSLQRSQLGEAGEPTDFSSDDAMPPDRPFGVDMDIERRTQLLVMRRSIVWVIGSSLAFEAAVLAAAAWIFCRRDY